MESKIKKAICQITLAESISIDVPVEYWKDEQEKNYPWTAKEKDPLSNCYGGKTKKKALQNVRESIVYRFIEESSYSDQIWKKVKNCEKAAELLTKVVE